MELFYAFAIIAAAGLNIAMIVAFFKLCSNVNKLTQKLCPDETQKPVQDLDQIAAELPELHPGDHVINDGIELVVADNNGYYYKCYHAYNTKVENVLHRAHLKPIPKK